MDADVSQPHWEHFSHDADIGLIGVGPTKAEAFRQAAFALTAVITDPASLEQKSGFEWWIPATGVMRVPGVIYASEALIRDMDEKMREQVSNVAALPGIQRASYAMPDAHWGYGFPIGGVAAFDPNEGGVVSAGGVGFHTSCGVRTLRTGLTVDEVEPIKRELATELSRSVPAGVGSHGRIHLDPPELDDMLKGGARIQTSSCDGRTEENRLL